MASLLLQRSTGRPQRVHKGTIMMTRSNRRWCSDAFEIACWSKERLRVAFSLDCRDREILSYVVFTTGGIDGNLIRDLMVKAMKARFGSPSAIHTHFMRWMKAGFFVALWRALPGAGRASTGP
jgi:putative transposase